MRETLATALGGVAANKLRSGLTILGLMIGVASVIVLTAVGTGSSSAVQSDIDSLGSNLLTVTAAPSIGGIGGGTTGTSLTQTDANAIEGNIEDPDVKAVAPVLDGSDVTLTYDDSTYEPTTFVGTSPSYEQVSNYTIADGTWFTKKQEKDAANVIVLGPTVVTELFGGGDPVGDTVEIDDIPFTVVGVTNSKGSNGTTDEDDTAFVPLTTAESEIVGSTDLSEILVQAKAADAVDAAETEVTDVLDTLDPPTTTDGEEESSFEVTNQSSVLDASDSSNKVFTTLLIEVAAISLLVGGIGVMNIMLVSVTERTREIGIRKAVGARRGDIMIQFLVEAVLVSVLGGLAGVVAGVIGSQFKIAGVQPVIAVYSIPVAFGAAVLIGLFFGTYPAARAALMRPIDALRFE